MSLPALVDVKWFVLAGAVSAIWFVKGVAERIKRNPRRLPLPPGPRGLPFVGNIRQIPTVRPWEGYTEISKEYGDIVYLEALGQPILLLGSLSRAIDLLDKRAVNYSDRPAPPVAELMGIDWAFPIMQYGPKWRQNRRAFHQGMSQTAVAKYHGVMQEETITFLRTLASDPKGFLDHILLYFGTTIMRSTYGFDEFGQNNPLIHDSEHLIDAFGEGVTPGRFLVNFVPAMKYIPEWVPGAGFQTFFRNVRQIGDRLLDPPFKAVQENAKNGHKSIHPSLAWTLIDRLPSEGDPQRAEAETIARNVCALTYMSGSETSVSSANAMMYVLATHPDVQQKVQAEIASVTGSDRLPTLSDRPVLPYTHAVVTELLRWYPTAALGVIHASAEDDEYDGYFIPKGTYVIPNIWAMLHDPARFDMPDDFIPERYLKDGKIDPSVQNADIAAFGFGRRICPGRHFSQDALFLFAASLLSVFNVALPKDELGNDVPITFDSDYLTIAKPRPFKCDLTLRSINKHLVE